MPIPVSMSTAEAEYMAAAICCMALAHFRSLEYDFNNLGKDNYNVNEESPNIPTVLLVDNSATVTMSKNFKQTKKNRHIARRYHYVREGTRMKFHKLVWIKNDDQLADDMTKTQASTTSLKHMIRTLYQIPSSVCGKEKQESCDVCEEQSLIIPDGAQEEY